MPKPPSTRELKAAARQPELERRIGQMERRIPLKGGGEGAVLVRRAGQPFGAAFEERYAASSVGTDAYAITLTPGPTAYAAGQEFRFKADAANTGGATLNVNGLGAKTILKQNDQALATGDIEAGQIVTVVYDGTNFQMQSQVASAAGGAGSDTTAIHDDTASEISGITEKTTPIAADLIVIEDSAAANVKKRVQLGNLPGAAGVEAFKEGTYTGDGTTGRAITGLGFRPKVVVIKADHATNGHAMWLSDTMSTSNNVTNSVESADIVSLDADGFTVSHLASANGRTNESGKTYYWYALGGDKVQTGTYTGDGAASQTILTAILSPVMVWVRRPASNSAILFYTTPMTTECHDFSATTGTTNKVTGLTASGFTVGSHAEVNGAGATYHYVAFAAADNLAVGTYAGDGLDDRELPATPMGFDPRLVHIKADAGQFCDWKVSSLAGDLTLLYGTAASVADKIQSLTPASGQFQVGQNVEVNNGALTYFFFAFGHAPLAGAHGSASHTEHATWKVLYTDGSGDEQELSLGVVGSVLESTGAAAAPSMSASTIKRTILLTAAGGAPTTTGGCGAVEKVELPTNDVDIWVLPFDADADESAFWLLPLPDNYDGGTLIAQFYWTSAGGSASQVVRWGIKGRAYQDGASIDAAYGTEVFVTDARLTLTNMLMISVESAAITLSGTAPAGGDLVQIKVTRDADHGDDTLAADARLIAVRLEYGIDAYSDA